MSMYSGSQNPPRAVSKRKIRIWGLDADRKPFSQYAWTIEIGAEHVRVEGVEAILRTGEVVGIANGDKRSRFRVLWAGASGQPGQGQAELQMVGGAMDDFWGMAMKAPPAVTPRHERRSVPRYRCSGFASMQQPDQSYKIRAPISDIALNGCYVELAMPFPPGTRFHISVTMGEVLVECRAVTVSAHPGVGMGVRFEGRVMVGKPELERLLHRLERDVGPRFIR